MTTSEVWDALRGSAEDQAASELQRTYGNQIPGAELQQRTNELLAGVGGQQVNTMRGLAGEWLAARENLHASDPGSQLFSNAIFRPPWAVTPNVPGVNEQYRMRVQVSYTLEGEPGTRQSTWGVYDLTTPPTSRADLLQQVLFASQSSAERYRLGLPADPISDMDIEDYELEAV